MALLTKKREGQRSDLARFRNEMDNLFNSFLGGWEWPSFSAKSWPLLDISDKEDEMMVRAEVPGRRAEDIDISVNGSLLTISGEKKAESEKQEGEEYYSEFSYGSFRRDINLPSDVDPDKIDAVCKNGILTVKLPKSEKSRPSKVKVKSED